MGLAHTVHRVNDLNNYSICAIDINYTSNARLVDEKCVINFCEQSTLEVYTKKIPNTQIERGDQNIIEEWGDPFDLATTQNNLETA